MNPVVPVMTTKGGRIPSFLLFFFCRLWGGRALRGWSDVEKKNTEKLLSKTSIDALLFPSRLTPPGPYDPETTPRHEGIACLGIGKGMVNPMGFG